MMLPKIDPVKFLLLYGIEYRNKIPPQSAYYCVKRDGMIWHIFDANRIPLGRMAGRCAKYITGKYKPNYDPKKVLQNNDRVLIVNGSNIRLTGKQRYQKVFREHTRYAGGLKEIMFKDLERKDPQMLIRRVVKGMIAPTKTREQILDRIKVVPGQYHNFSYLNIPQFMNQPLPDPNEMIGIPNDLNDLKDNYTVISESLDKDGNFQSLEATKDLPREYTTDFLWPETYRKLDYKKDPRTNNENRRNLVEYNKKMKRVREYK